MVSGLLRARKAALSILWATAAGIVTFAAPDSPRIARQTALESFREWFQLARDHAPAQVDKSITTLRAYSMTTLATLHVDLATFTQFLREPALRRPRQPRRVYTDQELAALVQLAADERATGAANMLLRQIALLHADAMALPGAVVFVPVDEAQGVGDAVTMTADGVGKGSARTPPLWAIARTALGAIQPSPATDAWTQQWYRATTAYMFFSFQLGGLQPHLDARRSQIPDDPTLTFDEACLQEAMAAERVQRVAAAERAAGARLMVPDMQSALVSARKLFEQVLKENPRHEEASVRHARVLWAMGETRRAVDELTALLRDLGPDREIRYYALLFLGAAQWNLGDADAAAEAYEAALKTFPGAQSAAVGLSLVKPRSAAFDLQAIEAVLKARPADRFDPWLTYHLGPGRKVGGFMDVLWNALIAR